MRKNLLFFMLLSGTTICADQAMLEKLFTDLTNLQTEAAKYAVIAAAAGGSSVAGTLATLTLIPATGITIPGGGGGSAPALTGSEPPSAASSPSASSGSTPRSVSSTGSTASSPASIAGTPVAAPPSPTALAALRKELADKDAEIARLKLELETAKTTARTAASGMIPAPPVTGTGIPAVPTAPGMIPPPPPFLGAGMMPPPPLPPAGMMPPPPPPMPGMGAGGPPAAPIAKTPEQIAAEKKERQEAKQKKIDAAKEQLQEWEEKYKKYNLTTKQILDYLDLQVLVNFTGVPAKTITDKTKIPKEALADLKNDFSEIFRTKGAQYLNELKSAVKPVATGKGGDKGESALPASGGGGGGAKPSTGGTAFDPEALSAATRLPRAKEALQDAQEHLQQIQDSDGTVEEIALAEKAVKAAQEEVAAATAAAPKRKPVKGRGAVTGAASSTETGAGGGGGGPKRTLKPTVPKSPLALSPETAPKSAKKKKYPVISGRKNDTITFKIGAENDLSQGIIGEIQLETVKKNTIIETTINKVEQTATFKIGDPFHKWLDIEKLITTINDDDDDDDDSD